MSQYTILDRLSFELYMLHHDKVYFIELFECIECIIMELKSKDILRELFEYSSVDEREELLERLIDLLELKTDIYTLNKNIDTLFKGVNSYFDVDFIKISNLKEVFGDCKITELSKTRNTIIHPRKIKVVQSFLKGISVNVNCNFQNNLVDVIQDIQDLIFYSPDFKLKDEYKLGLIKATSLLKYLSLNEMWLTTDIMITLLSGHILNILGSKENDHCHVVNVSKHGGDYYTGYISEDDVVTLHNDFIDDFYSDRIYERLTELYVLLENKITYNIFDL